VTDKKEILILRGERIQSIHGLLRLTRKQFTEKTQIPNMTLVNWEIGKNGGLNEKAAERLALVLKRSFQAKISSQWLLYGSKTKIYLPGTILDEISTDTENFPTIGIENLQNEISTFYKLYPNATHIKLLDDSLLPFYQKNDLLGGLKIQDFIGMKFEKKLCIVGTIEGENLLRIVSKAEGSSVANLYGLKNNIYEITHKSVGIAYIANILWLRRVPSCI
jgi:hypothetical protein